MNLNKLGCLLCVALMTVGFPIVAQAEEPPHLVGISPGFIISQIRDDVLTPLRWEGFGPVLEISYDHQGRADRHSVEMHLPASLNENRYDARAIAIEMRVAYGYLRTLTEDLAGGRFSLGGLIGWTLDDQVYLDWDEEHLYWLNAYELGPWATWSRLFEGAHRIEVGMDLPLVALASRPPRYRYNKIDKLSEVGFYFSRPHEDMAFTSFHEYLAFTLRGDYSYELSDAVSLGASLLLDYKTHSEPERIQVFNTVVLLRILITPGNRPEEERP